jgi:hypothetical protein
MVRVLVVTGESFCPALCGICLDPWSISIAENLLPCQWFFSDFGILGGGDARESIFGFRFVVRYGHRFDKYGN